MSVILFLKGSRDSIGGMEEHGWALSKWLEKNKIPHYIARYLPLETNEVKFEVEGIGLIGLDEMAETLPCKVLFHNTGHLIEHFSKLKKVFPEAIQVYRTGGNEVLQARLKNGPKDHNERQKIWVDSINNSIDILITNSKYTEMRYEKVGISSKLFFRAVGGTNAPLPITKKSTEENVLTIFCAARFVTYKNHFTLIKLLEMLILENYDANLYLAGDGPLLEAVKQQVESLNLEDQVTFLGEISPKDISKFFQKTDVYIQLSIEENRKVEGGSYTHTEGMGRSILAAISSATWIIAGHSGALPEIVYGSRGVTIDPFDYRSGVDSLKQWLDMGCPTPEQTNEYSWENYFDKYRLFLEV